MGYLGVVLALVVPVLWVLHARRRPRGWLCHMALGVALLAFLLAKLNSSMHVNRIQVDQSAELATAHAKIDAGRKAAEKARGDEVAQIRFAEDASGDFIDTGGMDDTDLKYMEKVAGAEPAWKANKKQRSTGTEDTSLEGLIGAKPAEGQGALQGADAVASDEKKGIVMAEREKDLANRMDAFLLMLLRVMMIAGVVILVVDYLQRVNRYDEAYFPLPLPDAMLKALSSLPAVQRLPHPPLRAMKDELAWLVKRGDSFLYMTDDPARAEPIPAELPRLGKRWGMADVVRVDLNDGNLTDALIFEALWYGRSSFVMVSPDRSAMTLGVFMELLAQRKACRARVPKTVHLVWGCAGVLDETWLQEFSKLARATGVCLVVCNAESA